MKQWVIFEGSWFLLICLHLHSELGLVQTRHQGLRTRVKSYFVLCVNILMLYVHGLPSQPFLDHHLYLPTFFTQTILHRASPFFKACLFWVNSFYPTSYTTCFHLYVCNAGNVYWIATVEDFCTRVVLLVPCIIVLLCGNYRVSSSSSNQLHNGIDHRPKTHSHNNWVSCVSTCILSHISSFQNSTTDIIHYICW